MALSTAPGNTKPGCKRGYARCKNLYNGKKCVKCKGNMLLVKAKNGKCKCICPKIQCGFSSSSGPTMVIAKVGGTCKCVRKSSFHARAFQNTRICV